MYQFKVKASEIKPYLLCLCNISKDFQIDNMKKTGLKESAKAFSVDCKPINSKHY